MAPHTNVALLNILSRARQRRKKIESVLYALVNQRQQLVKISFVIALLLLSGRNAAAPSIRSCRRFQRNPGWWYIVSETYSDARFKKTFRVSRNTFSFILERIRHVLERKTVVEEPVDPAFRLAICLYRHGRGTYYHTISELRGLGLSTVATITREVSEAIVEVLWDESVNKYMPNSEDTFRNKILDNGRNVAVSLLLGSDRWLSHSS